MSHQGDDDARKRKANKAERDRVYRDQHRGENGLCYQCGQKGHMRLDCPQNTKPRQGTSSANAMNIQGDQPEPPTNPTGEAHVFALALGNIDLKCDEESADKAETELEKLGEVDGCGSHCS
jgi:hypothetical protein